MSRFKSYSALLAAILLWSTVEVMVKMISPNVDVRFTAFARLLLASAVLFPIFRREIPKLRIKEFWILGLLGFSLHYFFFHLSIAFIKAASAATIICSIPVFVLLFSSILRKVRAGEVIGIPVAFAGISLFSFENLSIAIGSAIGVLLMCIAAALWALFLIVGERTVKEHGAAHTTFLCIVCGAILYFPFLLTVELGGLHIGLREILVLLYLGIFTVAIAYILYFFGLSRVGAVRASSFLYFKPLIATLFASLALNELITLPMMVGIFLVLVGVWLTTKE